MANTVISLRSSGVTGNTPSLGVLANGELSLNFADGILYYKTAANALGSIRTTQPAGLNQEIQFNDSGSFGGDSGLTYNKTTDTLTVAGQILGATLKSTQSSGDEGGQIDLALAATNQSLNSSVAIDIYQNRLRIFETGGTNRGVYIDMANGAAAGVATNLLNPTATPDTVARATANAAYNHANGAFDKANTDVTSISATAGVYGNATYVPVITLAANGRVSSITNTAISGISGGNSFGVIYTSNNSTYANATSSTDQLNFVGEAGIIAFANSLTKTITIAGTPGAQGLTVDYGYVYEAMNYSIDYGTL